MSNNAEVGLYRQTLINKVITIQGEGDYNRANKFINSNSKYSVDLRSTIDKLSEYQIPIDILLKDTLELN